MKITKETLESNYSCLSTDELFDLFDTDTLTEIAKDVLYKELIKRGVKDPEAEHKKRTSKISETESTYKTLDEFELNNKCSRLETLELIRNGALLRKDSGDRIYVAWKNINNHPTMQELRNNALRDISKGNNPTHSQLQENNRKHKNDEAIEEINNIKSIPFVTSECFATSKTIKTVGMARGSTVRAKHIGRDLMAEIKNIVGGELKGYTELLAEGREEAIYRMQSDAVRLGANAIVSVRFTSATIGGGVAEILAYGTAVIIESETLQ